MLQGGTGTKTFPSEWDPVHPTVISLLQQKHVTPRSWHDLFATVYNIQSWVNNGAQLIREAVSKEIWNYVTSAKDKLKSYNDDTSFLTAYANEWKKFYTQAGILPLPFKLCEERPTSINPSYQHITSEPLTSIQNVMLSAWNQECFWENHDRLLTTALKLVEKERNGETFDHYLVQAVRESFSTLRDLDQASNEPRSEFYRRTFERRYIENTVQYYSKLASQHLADDGVIVYMTYADRKLNEEEHRGRKYLDPSAESIARLMEECVRVLVVEFQDQILKESATLIANNDIEKLSMLYRLVRRTPSGIEQVLSHIDEHIRSQGLADMATHAHDITTDPEKYVTQLLAMFERFSALIRDGFMDDTRLLTARDKAFRAVVNDTTVFRLDLSQGAGKKGMKSTSIESKCPELLANYCDLLLRKTQLSKKLTSEQIDEKLNNLLLVLKYVANKDVFMRYHKVHLSRRLILEASADREKEEQMVARLRDNGMPADHINKLFRMLQDIDINADLNGQFKSTLLGYNNNKTLSDVINIKILNGGAWGRGSGERVKVSLPREMEDFVPEVETFYKQQHNGRKLTWMHHWSSGTMVFGTTNGGRFDLDVSTFQMAVLFGFNDRPTQALSFEALRLATELPDTELVKTLYSLVAFPKMSCQVLLCDLPHPISPRQFNDSTMFRINQNYHIVKNGKPQNRGRVNLIGRLQLHLEQSASKEHGDIIALRELRVQEAIVKIMKMRKQMTSAQLQTELVELLKPMFLPGRCLIKEQIDWLLENRFIERKNDDMNTFIYVT